MREYICAHTVFTALTERDFPSLDPCRLTVCTAGTDITGHALADALWSEHGVACEMADERSVVFILTESHIVCPPAFWFFMRPNVSSGSSPACVSVPSLTRCNRIVFMYSRSSAR